MAAAPWEVLPTIPTLLLTLSLIVLAILILSLAACSCPLQWSLLERLHAYGAPPRQKTHVCMTSLPARMRTAWWLRNLRNLLSQVRPRQLRLYVPTMTKVSREPYHVLPEVEELQGDHFTIVRVLEDEGPITKVRPALRDAAIGDVDIVIVVDDDIVYRDGVFALLEERVRADPKSVAAMCSPIWEGYKGMAFQKRLLSRLSESVIPEACFRVDDVLIDSFLRRHGIPVRAVLPPTGERGWACSIDSDASETHPPWDELQTDLDRRHKDTLACTAAISAGPRSG